MTIFRALRMLLALSCEESTRILSDEFDGEISRLEWWSVRLHAISCGACRRFRRQIVLMHEWLAQRGAQPAELSPEARERIANRLRQS